jgi:replicative DNA helicase
MSPRINLRALREAATARHVRGDEFILGGEDDDEMPAIWGSGGEVLWPDGESLWIAGGVGVGKSTILQQLILHGIGVRLGPFLGYQVAMPEGVVGYVAADRPTQIRRSFRRMVTYADADLLAERLDVWRGQFPFDLATAPVGELADFVEARGWSVLAIDSLKDVTSGTTDDDDGLAINRQLQEVLVRGVQVVVNHHDRKGDTKRGGPKGLDDLYGSRWLGAGAGSVLYVAGEPGSDEVELRHLKIPVDRIGPLTLRHDQSTGTTVVSGTPIPRRVRAPGQGEADVLAFLNAQGAKVETSVVAEAIGADVQLVRRWLRRLKDDGKVDSTRVGTTAQTEWWAS